MQYRSAHALSELLVDFLRENNLEQPYLENKILEAWPAVLGPTVMGFTGEMNIRDGVLFVHIKSAPLRQELFQVRYQLIRKLNEHIGATDVLRDIRFLG